MADHDSFPNDQDIQAFAQSTGADLPCSYDFTGLGDLAQREFERRTSRIPFLKDSSDVDRFFDPPIAGSHGQFIYLDAGLLELTSITIGYIGVGTGTVLNEGADFVLHDYNAPAEGRPWEKIQLTTTLNWRAYNEASPNFSGRARSLKVTGKWGYSTTVPEDVYQACLRLGASFAFKDIREGLAGGPTSWTEGSVSEKIDANLLSSLGVTMESYANRVISRYRVI